MPHGSENAPNARNRQQLPPITHIHPQSTPNLPLSAPNPPSSAPGSHTPQRCFLLIIYLMFEKRSPTVLVNSFAKCPYRGMCKVNFCNPRQSKTKKAPYFEARRWHCWFAQLLMLLVVNKRFPISNAACVLTTQYRMCDGPG
jgi:hypothetical protein